jgi:hypothetical protein
MKRRCIGLSLLLDRDAELRSMHPKMRNGKKYQPAIDSQPIWPSLVSRRAPRLPGSLGSVSNTSEGSTLGPSDAGESGSTSVLVEDRIWAEGLLVYLSSLLHFTVVFAARGTWARRPWYGT